MSQDTSFVRFMVWILSMIRFALLALICLLLLPLILLVISVRVVVKLGFVWNLAISTYEKLVILLFEVSNCAAFIYSKIMGGSERNFVYATLFWLSFLPKSRQVTCEKIQVGNFNVLIYQPIKKDSRDGLVYLQGGAWCITNASYYAWAVSYMAEFLNRTIVHVEVRLAPENPFPVPLEDAYTGLIWTQQNAALLGIDADKVVIMGDSAGGNLATACCLLHKALRGMPLDDRSNDTAGQPTLVGQVLLYPCLQGFNFNTGSMERNSCYGLQNRHMKYYTSLYISGTDKFQNVVGDPKLWDTLSEPYNTSDSISGIGNESSKKPKKSLYQQRDIISELCCFKAGENDIGWAIQNSLIFPLMSRDLADLPPAFIAVGSLDILLDDAKAYQNLLAGFGVRSELNIIPNAIHGFMLFAKYVTKSANVLRKIDTFIQKEISAGLLLR